MTDHADANAFAVAATLLTVAVAVVAVPDAMYEMLFAVPEPGQEPETWPTPPIGFLLTAFVFALALVTVVVVSKLEDVL